MALLGVGALEQGNWIIALGGLGIAGLQFVSMWMVKPMKDSVDSLTKRVGRLETAFAVMESRCSDHWGTQYQRHPTPRPSDDTPT